MELKNKSIEHTVWKNKKFTLNENAFRKIIAYLTSLVKTLVLRIFVVRAYFFIFHTVQQDSLFKRERSDMSPKKIFHLRLMIKVG